MPRERLVIIGGVAAGMSAASRARKLNPRLEIVVLEKGQHVSYGTCGLPYYLSGQVASPQDLVVYTAEFFREKRNIDIRLEHAPPFAPVWDPILIAANEAHKKITRS